MPELQTILDILNRFAGERPAVSTLEDHQLVTLSYSDLFRSATRVAEQLHHRSPITGPIGLIGPNSPRWIAAFRGIVAAGAVAMPFDAQRSDPDLAHMLLKSGCALALAAPLCDPGRPRSCACGQYRAFHPCARQRA